MDGSHTESLRTKRQGDELESGRPIKKSKEEEVNESEDIEKAIEGLSKIKELQNKILKQERTIEYLRSL